MSEELSPYMAPLEVADVLPPVSLPSERRWVAIFQNLPWEWQARAGDGGGRLLDRGKLSIWLNQQYLLGVAGPGEHPNKRAAMHLGDIACDSVRPASWVLLLDRRLGRSFLLPMEYMSVWIQKYGWELVEESP